MRKNVFPLINDRILTGVTQSALDGAGSADHDSDGSRYCIVRDGAIPRKLHLRAALAHPLLLEDA